VPLSTVSPGLTLQPKRRPRDAPRRRLLVGFGVFIPFSSWNLKDASGYHRIVEPPIGGMLLAMYWWIQTSILALLFFSLPQGISERA
jgi:hypothetical protein